MVYYNTYTTSWDTSKMPTFRRPHLAIPSHQHSLFPSPLPPPHIREMLLATSHRKAKNIWMELLQEQNPRLLPPVVENASSKPAYIQRMRLEKAMRGDGRSTATLPVSGRPRQVTRVMSLPTTSADLPGHSVRVLQRDSSTEDDSEGVSPSLSPASVARHASLPAPDLKVPVRPPRPPGREAARPISPSLGLKALSLSSSSSDSS